MPESTFEIIFEELNGSALTPTLSHKGDAGWDLASDVELRFLPGAFILVPTGIRIAMPETIFGVIQSRSSTFRNYGLMVIEGLIDPGYRGELMIQTFRPLSQDSRDLILAPRSPFAQIRFHNMPKIEFKRGTVDLATARGEGGFGSSDLGRVPLYTCKQRLHKGEHKRTELCVDPQPTGKAKPL